MNPAKILIVDDDQDHNKILGAAFRASGYQVYVAIDGLQAVTAARRQKPDLIVLDLGIPGGDGFSVLRRLKEMTTVSEIPVIVLSARDAESNSRQAVEAGAEIYIQKPPDLQALVAMVGKLLGKTEPNPAG